MQANAYQTRVHDLIAYDAARGMPGNVEDAGFRGLELTGTATLAEWTLRGQLGWLDARNLDSHKRLARRPQRSTRLDLDRDVGAWGFGVSAIAEAARWDDTANALRVGGYATLDARVSWHVASAWTLQAAVVNALDKRYQTSAWYPQPGREITLSLRWQPQ
jgi:vitamin B12 transporter